MNNIPTAISLSSSTVDENVAINTVVGTLTTTDLDTAQTYSYTIQSQSTSGMFSISGDKLVTAGNPDYEASGGSYSVTIQSTDHGKRGGQKKKNHS